MRCSWENTRPGQYRCTVCGGTLVVENGAPLSEAAAARLPDCDVMQKRRETFKQTAFPSAAVPALPRRALRWAEQFRLWTAAGRPVRSDAEVERIFRECCLPCANCRPPDQSNASDAQRKAAAAWTLASCNLFGCHGHPGRHYSRVKMATSRCPLAEPKWTEASGQWSVASGQGEERGEGREEREEGTANLPSPASGRGAGGEGGVDWPRLFDRIVVINLKRRPERLDLFRAKLRDCNWPYGVPEVMEALDGKILPEPDGWLAGKGGWGCMLSHIRIIEKVLLDEVDSVLVFEDDAVPADNFIEQFRRFIAELPPDWDALWLGGQNFGPSESVSENVLKVKNPHRMHAYALRGRAIREVYQRLVSSKTHCDHTLTPWIGRSFNVYAPRKPLFGQAAGKSDICGKTVEKTNWFGFGDLPLKEPKKIVVDDDTVVTVHAVGYGEAKCDGTLGYPGEVQLPFSTTNMRYISAHANHDLTLEIKRPVRIRGALNLSSDLDYGRNQTCDFWIDWHWIGSLQFSGSATSSISLPPGSYRLRADATPHAGWCHSLWLIEEEQARSERLALVTVGAYREGELKSVAGRLHESAAKLGLLLHSFGVNTRYGGHNEGKIRRLRDWLKTIPETYSHVMFADCKDTFLVAEESEILSTFHKFAAPIVVSAEENNWPTFNDQFREAIIGDDSTTSKARTINSGLWIGERAAVLAAFDKLVELREQIDAGLMVYPGMTGKHDNQFCWQAARYLKRFDVAIDYEHRLFLSMWGNKLDPLKSVTWGRIAIDNDTFPVALHFNGCAGIQRWWSLWMPSGPETRCPIMH